jgi:hypothetical protein
MLNKLFGLPQSRQRKATEVGQIGTVSAMQRKLALDIAERALIFLANRPGDIQNFLTTSGLDPDVLQARSADQVILAAALGHLAADESLARTFSEEEHLKPGQLLQAFATLDPHGSTAW